MLSFMCFDFPFHIEQLSVFFFFLLSANLHINFAGMDRSHGSINRDLWESEPYRSNSKWFRECVWSPKLSHHISVQITVSKQSTVQTQMEAVVPLTNVNICWQRIIHKHTNAIHTAGNCNRDSSRSAFHNVSDALWKKIKSYIINLDTKIVFFRSL